MSKLKVSLILKSYAVAKLANSKRHLFIFPFLNALRLRKPSLEKENNVDKLSKYWVRKTIPEIISEADKLFDDEEYIEVYEMLNNLRFSKEVEVFWRIARALYQMSNRAEVTPDVRWEMIEEAYKVLEMALSIGQSKAILIKNID